MVNKSLIKCLLPPLTPILPFSAEQELARGEKYNDTIVKYYACHMTNNC